MEGRTALVTGGAGFIGSHLVRRLIEHGYEVAVFDNLSAGSLESLADLGPGVRLIQGDIRDLDELSAVAMGATVMFHLAAIVSVPKSLEDPVGVHDVNATGTLNALLAAKEAGVDRFVFASSTSVYGPAQVIPICEVQPGDPLSAYGASKLTGEAYCSAFWHSYGLPTVSLRFFNVYGPGQARSSGYAAAIPAFIDALLAGRAPIIFGDGRQTRDFVFVEDVVRASLLAARSHTKAMGQAFNVASGTAVSIGELARQISGLVGSRVEPDHAPPRPGDIRHSVADVTAAREILGFEAVTSLEDGLLRTVNWVRATQAR